MPRLLSVNVGLPRDVTWNGKTVRTSVWKSPVTGRRMVRKLDIDGDAQADLAGHGGEQRAVFVYQMDSYHYWERFLGRGGTYVARAIGQYRTKPPEWWGEDVETGWRASLVDEGTVRLSSKGESDRITQRSAVQIRPPQP